jgi:hypothetical protein
MLLMSWSSHAVVPRVVYDLEGDENKIRQAIWGLIVEQGLEKLGVFEFVSNHFLLKSTPL